MEIVLEVKNTGYNLRKSDLSQVRRQKYISVLDDVLKYEYDKYVNPNGLFYKNYIFLKPGAKQYIMDLMMGAKSASSASASASASSSSSATMKAEMSASDSAVSEFDIEDYADQKYASSKETASMDLNSVISSKWQEYNKAYGAGYVEKSVISSKAISAGSVVEKSKYSTEKTTERAMEEFQSNVDSQQLTYSSKKKLESFIKTNNNFFQYLASKKQKIDKELIDVISSHSAKGVWEYYKEKLQDPYFHFIYEKRFGGRRAERKEENLDKWETGIAAISKTEDLKINNYNNLNYVDTIAFRKQQIACKDKGKAGFSVDKAEVSDPLEVFVEPPITEETAPIGSNVSIVIPPKEAKVSSVPIPSSPDLFNEITQPFDSADIELPSIVPKKEIKTDQPWPPKCTSCTPACKDVYPACLKCPNPNNPNDPACNKCTKDHPNYPNCRDPSSSAIPLCPDGKASCCIEGRPTYPACLCDDDAKKVQCCEKNPKHPKCVVVPPKCQPGDTCCMNPAEESCKKKAEEEKKKKDPEPPIPQTLNEVMGDAELPDIPCIGPSCAAATSPPSTGKPAIPSPNNPSSPPGDEPCLHPPCCKGPDDPLCREKKPPAPGVPSPDVVPGQPGSEPSSPPGKKGPGPRNRPHKPFEPEEELRVDILTVSSKESFDLMKPTIPGQHVVVTLKGETAKLFKRVIDKANKGSEPEVMGMAGGQMFNK